jgi:hypothetical protein
MTLSASNSTSNFNYESTSNYSNGRGETDLEEEYLSPAYGRLIELL